MKERLEVVERGGGSGSMRRAIGLSFVFIQSVFLQDIYKFLVQSLPNYLNFLLSFGVSGAIPGYASVEKEE
jgi:hypothetical protein